MAASAATDRPAESAPIPAMSQSFRSVMVRVVASSSDPYRQQRQQGQQSQADQDFRTQHGPQRQMLALAQGGLQAIAEIGESERARQDAECGGSHEAAERQDRKSTRLTSSH